jgi:hypothetical protein
MTRSEKETVLRVEDAKRIVEEIKQNLTELETDILVGNGTDVYYADQIKKVLEML